MKHLILSLGILASTCQPALAARQSSQAPALASAEYDPHGKATRAWQASNAEELTIDHRLIGLGCGPSRLTYTAVEEDEFPAPCYAVGTPEEMCPASYPYDDEQVMVWECARYLGDGW